MSETGTAISPHEPANPVHMSTGPRTRWTTVNFAEELERIRALAISRFDPLVVAALESAIRAGRIHLTAALVEV